MQKTYMLSQDFNDAEKCVENGADLNRKRLEDQKAVIFNEFKLESFQDDWNLDGV
jgi:hypothetical protein